MQIISNELIEKSCMDNINKTDKLPYRHSSGKFNRHGIICAVICLFGVSISLFFIGNNRKFKLNNIYDNTRIKVTESVGAEKEEFSVKPKNVGSDLTVKLATEEINLSNPICSNLSEPEHLMGHAPGWKPINSIEDLVTNVPDCIQIIRGKVQKVEYIDLFNKMTIYTLSTVQVEEVIRGDLGHGDLITMIESGGYTTLGHFYEVNPDRMPEDGSDIPLDYLMKWESPHGGFPEIGQEMLVFVARSDGEFYPEGLYTVFSMEFPAKYTLNKGVYRRSNPLNKEIFCDLYPENRKSIEDQLEGIKEEVLIAKIKEINQKNN